MKFRDEKRHVWDLAIELKSALKRYPDVKSEMTELDAAIKTREEEIDKNEQELVNIGFSQKDHDRIINEFEKASEELNKLQLDCEKKRGEVKAVEAILGEIEREEKSLSAKLAELKKKRDEKLHLQVLAEAMDKLRRELNDQIRPELQAATGEILSIITDGRYNAVEIDENYQATILDDNERKPVISGGEEDVVNLALRLAISQMIADRAGQSFSLLVLDEVFGSLDETRRDNVVGLLQNLKKSL